MEEISQESLDQRYLDLLDRDYYSVVSTLKQKYGSVPGNYFTDSSCEVRTRGLSRTARGLCIHHVAEDKLPGLSTTEFASESPWEYQLADNLVYCNLIEHLILHIKIYQHRDRTVRNQIQLGLSGALKIMREIDAFYCGGEPENLGEMNLLRAIMPLRDEYLFIVEYAQQIGIVYMPNTLKVPYHRPILPIHRPIRSIPRPRPIRYSSHEENRRDYSWIIGLLLSCIVVAIVLGIAFSI